MKNRFLKVLGVYTGTQYVVSKHDSFAGRFGVCFTVDALTPSMHGYPESWDRVGEPLTSLDAAIEVIENYESMLQADRWEQWGEDRLFGVNA